MSIAVDPVAETRDELRAKLAQTPERMEKFVRPEVKAIKPDEYEVEVIISTPSIDRDHEVIEPRAFKSARGKLLPLVDSHMIGEGVDRTLGVATITKITDTEVIAKLRYFVGKGNTDADYAWHLVTEGIAAYSHAFMPRKFTDADLDDEKTVREILEGKREVRRYHDIESYEVSQVIVGSNRDARIRSVAKGLFTEQEIIRIEELVNKETDDKPAPVVPITTVVPLESMDDLIEIKATDDEPDEKIAPADVADATPPDTPSPVPVAEVSIRRIREEGTDAPETLEVRSGEALVFAGTPEALILALHAAKGQPNVTVTVIHKHEISAEVSAETRAALVSDLTSGLKEVTALLQSTIKTFPSVPAHVAQYPPLKDLVKAIAETVIPHAEKSARAAAVLEVAKVTGNVDAHLVGR